MEFLRKYSPLFTFGILAIAIVALIIGQLRSVRTDIKDVRTELKADIKDVRTELTARMDRMEVRMDRMEVRMDRTDSKIDRLGDKMDTLILSLSNRKPASQSQ